jgi:hypothetical protein
MNILGSYLPQAGGDSQMQGTAYSEGGTSYTLGLIDAVVGQCMGRHSELPKVKWCSMGWHWVWASLEEPQGV